MSTIRISFFGATDIGKVRTNNEDAFIAQQIWDDHHFLLVAIDGMGSEEGGEIAADIAKESIIKYLTDFQNDTDLNLIKRAIADANNEIIRQKEFMPKYRRMGCVATAGIINVDSGTLSIAHVGDSRLYRYTNGELSKLTHDHSLVGYQEEQGILTEEQAMKHPRRSVIERCLGYENHYAEDNSFIEAGVFPLVDGEKFIFCSDGLCDMLMSNQIAECMSSGVSPEDECYDLINKANEAGGKDNITVVIAHVDRNDSVDRNAKGTGTTHEDIDDLPQNKRKKTSRKWLWIFCLISVITGVIALLFIMEYCEQPSKTPTRSNTSEGHNHIWTRLIPNDTLKKSNDSILIFR